MAASYPSSVKSFTALNTGDFIEDTHQEAAYDEITAIENALLSAGLAHALIPDATANNRDLGSSTKQWRDLYVARGVQFPATQNASSDANMLDDYEEGSWTPVIGGAGGTSGQTYTVQIGKYTKIGRMVFGYCYVVLSVEGTITGNVEIQGLPFASENLSNHYTPTAPFWWNSLATNWVHLTGYIAPSTSAISVRGAAAAAATSDSALTAADIQNGSSFMATFHYMAAA